MVPTGSGQDLEKFFGDVASGFSEPDFALGGEQGFEAIHQGDKVPVFVGNIGGENPSNLKVVGGGAPIEDAGLYVGNICGDGVEFSKLECFGHIIGPDAAAPAGTGCQSGQSGAAAEFEPAGIFRRGLGKDGFGQHPGGGPDFGPIGQTFVYDVGMVIGELGEILHE